MSATADPAIAVSHTSKFPADVYENLWRSFGGTGMQKRSQGMFSILPAITSLKY
jgi:hypothetical protein